MDNDILASAAKDAVGKIGKTAGDLAGEAQNANGLLADAVAERPFASLLVAGAICYALGRLSRRR